MKSLLMILCLAGAIGCGSSEPDPQILGSAGPTDLELSLSEPRSYTMDVEGLTSAVSLRLTGDWATEGGRYASLPIQEGQVTVSASDGTLQLEELTFTFKDIVVDDVDDPPVGIHLTDLAIALGAATSDSTDWCGATVDASGKFDLLLSWSALEDGAAVPLAEQQLQQLSFDIEVDDDGLRLESISTGPVWTFGDFITMSDAHISVHAVN